MRIARRSGRVEGVSVDIPVPCDRGRSTLVHERTCTPRWPEPSRSSCVDSAMRFATRLPTGALVLGSLATLTAMWIAAVSTSPDDCALSGISQLEPHAQAEA